MHTRVGRVRAAGGEVIDEAISRDDTPQTAPAGTLAAPPVVAALAKPLSAASGAKLKNTEAAQADLSGFEC